MAILPVSLAGGLCDHILPPVQEIRATRAVSDDKIRLKGLHALEFLMGVGQGISPIAFYEILPETETAAMPSFRIVHDFSSPSLDHSHEDVGIFSATYTL